MGVIARGVFGIDVDAFDDENESEFVKEAKYTQFKLTLRTMLGFFFYILAPRLALATGFRLMAMRPFFSNLCRGVLDQRRRQGAGRQNDMLQLFIDLQEESEKKGPAAANGGGGDDGTTDEFEEEARLTGAVRRAFLSEDKVTQSAVLFLVAGFDTTATTLSLVSYWLAANPGAQEEARREADEIAAGLGDGQSITYDDIAKYGTNFFIFFSFLMLCFLAGWSTLRWW